MLNLDQIKLLEGKVEKAVRLINSLSNERDSLIKQIEEKDKRIAELENLILILKDDQSKIEQGIIHALNKLSAFEASVHDGKEQEPPQPSAQAVFQPQQEHGGAYSSSADAEKASSQEEQSEADSLQKDLNDVFGEPSDTDKQSDIDKQMDIF